MAYLSWTFARGGFQATGGILKVEANAEMTRGEGVRLGFVGLGWSAPVAVADDNDGSSLGTPRSRDRKFSVAVGVEYRLQQVTSVLLRKAVTCQAHLPPKYVERNETSIR